MNHKIILKIFSITKKIKIKISIVLFTLSTENLKTLKRHTFSKKTLVPSIICSKCGNEY